jgi:hypothetical protein
MRSENYLTKFAALENQPKWREKLCVPNCVMVNESKYLLILWIQSLEFWCDNEQNLIEILCGYKLKKFKKETCYVSYMKGQIILMLINVMKELHGTWSRTCMHHVKFTKYKFACLSL